jgi:hypothetical protein
VNWSVAERASNLPFIWGTVSKWIFFYFGFCTYQGTYPGGFMLRYVLLPFQSVHCCRA